MENFQTDGKNVPTKSSEEAMDNDSLLLEQTNPEFNQDETNDFDLKIGKKPALSSMQNSLKFLNKNLIKKDSNNNTPLLFDSLKMGIDLGLFAEQINFNFNIDESNMVESDFPEKPPSRKEEHDKFIEQYRNISYTNFPSETIQDDNFEDELVADMFGELNENLVDKPDEINSLTFEDVVENSIISKEKTVENIFNKDTENLDYPNCKISYDVYSQNAGITNIYIKNNELVIYLSGKFASETGILGHITKDNIKELLNRVCNLAGFSFSIDEFINLASVFLCDTCLDIELKNQDEIKKVVIALSSLFPLASNKYSIKKFGDHALSIKSKAKKTGSSLVIYNKYYELKNSPNRGKRIASYLRRIGREGIERAKNILRIECKMYSLEDMRSLLDLPRRYKFVALTDVLNSTSMPIIKRFKAFEATEKILNEKIWGYIRTETSNRINSKVQLRNRLASERVADIVTINNYDIIKARDHFITEYEIENINTIKELVPEIKQSLWNFLLYRKPKAIKRVINLLEKIHISYCGEEAGADNE